MKEYARQIYFTIVGLVHGLRSYMRVKVLKTPYLCLLTLSSILIILLLTTLSLTPMVACEAEEEAISLLREVYSKLIEAEKAGADISNASQLLNKALTLIKSPDESRKNREESLQQAISMIREVDSMVPTLIEEGRRAAFLKNFYTGLTITSIISSILLAYFFTPRIFWKLWVRARKHWIVKVSSIESGRLIDRRRS